MFDFSRIAAIIGIVWQVVQMIEQVLVGQSGAMKKEAVVRVVNQTLGDAGAPTVAGDAEIIGKSIDTAVEVFNRFKVFSHPGAESRKPQHHEEPGQEEPVKAKEPVKEKKGK